MNRVPDRRPCSPNAREPALLSAHKIAVALPVLPSDLKSPAILKILHLLKAGLSSRGGL